MIKIPLVINTFLFTQSCEAPPTKRWQAPELLQLVRFVWQQRWRVPSVILLLLGMNKELIALIRKSAVV